MAIRFSIQATAALLQSIIHYMLYFVYICLYQALSITELICWHIDQYTDVYLAAHPPPPQLPPTSTVPAYLKYSNKAVRLCWSYLMRAICIIHVSHSHYCSGHHLPSDVASLVAYFYDYGQQGPCADYNLN